MEELKRKIVMSGKTRLQIAKAINVPYGTLTGYLNEFIPMPEHVREAIEKEIKGDEQ